MKKLMMFLGMLALGVSLVGCQSKRLPSEDIEIATLYPELIATLKNPDISRNSKEKYDAIKKLIKHVDFEFTREAKTIDDLLYHGDAVTDAYGRPDRTITFSYQYGDHYVRLEFALYEQAVLRATVIEK